jgi:FAD/FMN-containing dehydrogenase
LSYLNSPLTTFASLEIRMDIIRSLLAADELIDPASPTYTRESLVWSAQKYLKPQLVARPGSVESLSRLLAALNDNDLEFSIRCGVCGPASAKDVPVSLSAFDRFEFD